MPRGVKRQPQEGAAAAASMAEAQSVSVDPLQPNRSVENMGEAELRQYALQVGITPRDARELTVDRLRQNCMLVLAQLIEDI